MRKNLYKYPREEFKKMEITNKERHLIKPSIRDLLVIKGKNKQLIKGIYWSKKNG